MCPTTRSEAFEQVRELYARVGVTALEPLGFNNTFAILVRTRDARRLGLRSIDDLRGAAGGWTPGFGYEFLQRADGYPGLSKTYGLSFRGAPRAMDLSLIYRALGDGQVDVIAGDATSAQIDALDLTALDDNRHYFPPYDAAPVVRTPALLRHPEIGRAMARLVGHVTERDMRAMNRAVDVDRRDPPPWRQISGCAQAGYVLSAPPPTRRPASWRLTARRDQESQGDARRLPSPASR